LSRVPFFVGGVQVAFEYQPTLRGQLVHVRPLREDDYSALYAVAVDPLIWEQHPARNRHEAAVFGAFFREAMESGGALLVLDVATERVIGSSRFHGYDVVRREVEIGWTFLARSHWGGRYNGELKRLMLEHAFRFVDHVIFLVGPENVRSQRAVEKLGGIRAGSRRDGAGRDSNVYRISAPGAVSER
jgi:RimJ/RimL family protein N-acetyltransferase